MSERKRGRLQVTPDEVARLMSHVKRLKNGCWHWTGSAGSYGYAQVTFRGGHDSAHRLFYRVFVAAIPRGFVIHHRCRNRRCVNPDHLEATVTADNVRRTILRGPEHYNAAKTHCKRGHPFSGTNLIVEFRPDGARRRACRICQLEFGRKRQANYKRRRREKAAARTSRNAESA